jgi:hypothetical protein
MKAMFVKELRESAKWAAAIAGVLGVLVLLEIRKANPFILNQLAQQKVVYFAPLAGLLMGIAQSFFETRPDNWAFVVHRPLSRRSIFAAKAVAGLLLLYTALALPCLLAGIWATRPGNVATPFHGRTVLPLVADIFNSGCFYFAGMVLTLRNARWIGSRLLPLGLAVAASLAVQAVPDFWQALLFSCAGLAISAAAAWNVFVTGGTAERGGAPSLALGAMVFVGALGVTLVLVDFVGVFSTIAIWHDVRLDRDGNVLRITWTWDEIERTCTVADVAGRPLAEYQGIDVDDAANADRFVQFSNLAFDDQFVSWPYSMELRGYRSLLPEIVRLKAVAKPRAASDTHIASSDGNVIALPIASGATRVPYICILDTLEQIIKLYDPVTHVLLGTVGPTGFASAQAPPGERFPNKPLNLMFQADTHTLAFPSVVYWMELDRRRVRKLFTAPSDDPVISACELPPQSDPTVVILTRKKFHVLKSSGDVVFAVPFALDKSKYYFQFAVLPSNHHLVLRAVPLPKFANSNPQQLLEYASDGTLARQISLAQTADEVSPRQLRRTVTMGAIWPPALFPLYAFWNLDWVFETDYRQCWSPLLRSMLASSLICGAATLFLSRRLGFGIEKTAAWTIANMLLGPAGVVVILSLNDWPARETCTTCGRKRLIGRRKCSCCNAPLSPPSLDGREIFEPDASLQLVG